MSYSLKQAADATGKDRSTIQRAIKNGRISANLNEAGAYEINPAELHRVFPVVVRNEGKAGALQQSATDETASENRELRAKVELLREMVGQIEEERDEWRDQCKRMTLLLTDQSQQPKAAPPEPAPARAFLGAAPWFWVAFSLIASLAVAWFWWNR